MSPEKNRLYAVIIVTVFCLFIVMGIGNFRAKQLAVKIAGDHVTKAVSIAADIDISQLQEVILSLDESHPYYAEIRSKFIRIKNDYNLQDMNMLYKHKTDKEDKWLNIVDARDKTDPNHKPLGQMEKRASAAVEKTIRGKVVLGEYQNTSLGPVVSSYEEIKDSKGITFAVLGGSADAAEMTDFLYITRYAQMGIIAFGLMLISLICLLRKQ